jgi:cell division transport system permease protein
MQKSNISQKRPQKSSANHIYSIFSITLILFFIACIVVGYNYAKNEVNALREDIKFELEIDKNASEGEKVELRKSLSEIEYVKTIEYVSKEEAVAWHQEQLGDNYMDQLQSNPLYDAYFIQLKSNYVHPDSIQKIKTELYTIKQIKDISYSEVAVNFVSSNLKKLTILLGIICLLFLIIAVTLIDSTIRLSMYSQRFLIRSMQLIGATPFFIIKPFLKKGIINGVISAILAFVLIAGLILYVNKQYDFYLVAKDLIIFALPTLLVGLIAIGILLSSVSTWIAVRKYLRMKLDELY